MGDCMRSLLVALGVIPLLALTASCGKPEPTSELKAAGSPTPTPSPVDVTVTVDGVFAVRCPDQLSDCSAGPVQVVLPYMPVKTTANLIPIPAHTAVLWIPRENLVPEGATDAIVILGRKDPYNPMHGVEATWRILLSYTGTETTALSRTGITAIPPLRMAGDHTDYETLSKTVQDVVDASVAATPSPVAGLAAFTVFDGNVSVETKLQTYLPTPSPSPAPSPSPQKVQGETRYFSYGIPPKLKTLGDGPFDIANVVKFTRRASGATLTLVSSDAASPKITFTLKPDSKGKLEIQLKNMPADEVFGGTHGSSYAFRHALLAYLLTDHQDYAAKNLYFADWNKNPASDPFCNGPVRVIR